MVKVTSKPIADALDGYLKTIPVGKRSILDNNSLIIDFHRPQMRVGAFEIVLAIKHRGELKEEVIHSKLKTRLWPNIDYVLSKIANYIPHTNIMVQVFDPEGESAQKSLSGIPVTLVGKIDKIDDLLRKFNSTLQEMEAKKLREMQKKSRANVRKASLNINSSIDFNHSNTRPQSAISYKTMNSVNRSLYISRGQGLNNERSVQYFFSFSYKKHRRSQIIQQSQIYQRSNLLGMKRPKSAMPITRCRNSVQQLNILKTDENGAVVFHGVAFNNYVIKVLESSNFGACEKRLDLINEKSNANTLTVYVELKPQKMSFINLKIIDNDKNLVKNANVIASLLNPMGLENQNDIQYLYQLDQNRENEGEYQGKIYPGEYMLIIKHENYREFNKYFIAQPGSCTQEIELEKNIIEPKLIIHTIDIDSGELVSGVLIKIQGRQNSTSVESLTDSKGQIEINFNGPGYYNLQVSKENYISYTHEICYSRNSKENIVIPMIQCEQEIELSEKTIVKLCLIGDNGISGLNLNIMCPIDEDIVSKAKNISMKNMTELEVKNSESIGQIARICSGVNEWYRIFISCDSKNMQLNKNDLDKYLRNQLTRNNISLFVLVNNELKYIIPAPEFIPENYNKIWDLGFINAYNGEMMLINSITNEMPATRLEFSNEYFALYSLINSTPNLKSLFGIFLIN